MQLRTLALPATLAVVALAALTFARARSSHEASIPGIATASADESGPAVPVVVELFTSEGCSSCPPAEEELLKLESEESIPGARVVPIAFHVDYWNDLGWADPFSTGAWTDRQRDYDRATGRVYTPQAVVNGGRECVGSDDSALRSYVRQAASQPAAHVTVARSATPAGPNEVKVTVNVSAMPAGTAGDQGEVRVVLVEHGVVVDVPRGENGGKRLRHAPLARAVANAGVVSAAGGSFEATLTIPSAAQRSGLSVVAMVQEHGSHKVLGAGTLTP